jgi:ABC-type dipeptide/oligopeptide/nickel transport system ATPase component
VPDHIFYSPQFQSHLSIGVGIARQIGEAITKLQNLSPQSNLHHLELLASLLSQFKCTKSTIIGVLGNSGEGKSALINSLLHLPEIARTGDNGVACTSLVSEYRCKKPQHTAPIHIEVERLSEKEIHDLIGELVWSVRKLFLPGVEKKATDEYVEIERESNLAWSSLNTAFGHRDEFSEKLFEDDNEEGLEQITSMLISWTKELEWPKGEGNDDGGLIWRTTAQDAIECGQKTEIFMKDRFWPFTKIVRVYLDSPLLRSGVVLADMPGLQDTNLARVRTTQEYLMRCDTVLLVAGIARVVTNQSVKSSLNSVLTNETLDDLESSSTRHSKLAIVCTKMEDINEKSATMDFVGLDKCISLEDMGDINQDINTAAEADDLEMVKILKLKRRLKLIDARNNSVKEGLNKAYSDKLSSGQLEVFCVSNKWYEEYSAEDDIPMANTSGIPALRQYCYQTTASTQLASAKTFLNSQLGSLLCSSQIWLDKYQDNVLAKIHKATLATAVNECERQGTLRLNQFENDLKSLVKTEIQHFGEKLSSAWTEEARNRARGHAKYHHMTYDAFCRRDGVHKTKRQTFTNWNADFIWKMKVELDGQWDTVEEEAPVLFDNLEADISKLSQHIVDIIEGDDMMAKLSPNLIPAIGHRSKCLSDTLESVNKKKLSTGLL